MADGYEETEYNGIPYRTTRSERSDEFGVIWHIEYKQAKTYPWGPRGIMHERDGRFFAGDRDFGTAHEALRYRAIHL
ncbi:hypothetical protein L1277_002710 [Okibacterium sp. HSC-33S16]|nr:hypothetical protein [Okibacterium sp. HSC-33S16]